MPHKPIKGISQIKLLQLGSFLIRRIKFIVKKSPMINIGIINNKGNKTVKDKKRFSSSVWY
jgi:hypothetical protein